ncbi:ArsR/SmtB family transcription factor [Ktedonospora formicarum]|uniref:Transcriptional regulator n=1 Tax=Ktedonospora formicarum TaxID=2778364 RepID=A0A8J3I874_9CHLR|nr:winged helix-turn-helix domain-containing protein [Ktedonospora formicarum]GHO48983.1 transcriptional regulator [Ktedonospora formicarum]
MEYFVYNRNMNDTPKDVNIAAVAALISNPSRAVMLDALLNKQALPAGELTYRAGISPQTASAHLAKLVDGGLLILQTQGRHRYYALSGPEVAHALEALAVIAPPARVRSLRASVIAERLHFARTCYDHLAGKLGVSLTQALLDAEILHLEEQNPCYQVTEPGVAFLSDFGISLEKLRHQRRAFARPCLDWSERRNHLAGALGAALCERLFQLGWLEKRSSERMVQVTRHGLEGLRKTFGLQFP